MFLSDNIFMFSLLLDNLFLTFCGLTLLARLFLQPSLNKLETLGQEHIATLLNCLIILAITFLFIIKKTIVKENLRLPKVLGPLALFCLIASFSISYSIDAPSSLLFGFDLWGSLCFMIVLVNLLKSVKNIEWIIGVLIALMILSSAHTAYEHLVILPKIMAQNPQGDTERGLLQLIASHRSPTLFGWPNILAGFLVMTLPLTMTFLTPRRPRVIKTLAGCALILGLYALIITMTISSWISLLVAAGIFVFIFKKTSVNRQAKIWIALILSLIFAVMIFTVIKKTTLPGANSADARSQYFISSCCLIKLHPFIGSGWRSFGVANVPYIKDINGRSFFAHNSYLQIWTELGILGLAAFGGFLWMMWKDILILIQERRSENFWLIAALIAGIGGCMVDNVFSYTMIKPQIAFFWWVLCALLIALKENLKASDCMLKYQATWKKIILIMTLAGGIMCGRLALAEYDFFTAVHYIHQGTQLEAAEILCRKAKELNPWDKKFDLARAYALYSTYNSNHDIQTLLQARDAALSTEGQVSLNFEREALLNELKGHNL